MFQLTRQERILVVAILLAFVTGLIVKSYRSQAAFSQTPAQTQNADQ
ncbi:MAG: hypothetical protein WA771_03030 [Chthoniobacterales bacterium]